MNRITIFAIGLSLLLANVNATAETLWTYSYQPVGFHVPVWDRSATLAFSDGDQHRPPFLFEESLVTIDSIGQDVVLVANAQTDPDFDYFARLLTNGIDETLNIEIRWNGTPATSALTGRESSFFYRSPYRYGVDLIGSQISTIVLRIVDITDGTPNYVNALFLGYKISIEGTPPPDADSDGIADVLDNCRLHANPSQNDPDSDGIGTRCDGDFNNDCVVNFLDLGLMRASFSGAHLLYDLDESGAVNFGDLAVLGSFLFLQPGPSGLANVCDP